MGVEGLVPAGIPSRVAEYELHRDRTGCSRGRIARSVPWAAPAGLDSPRMPRVGAAGYKDGAVRVPRNRQVMENKETADPHERTECKVGSWTGKRTATGNGRACSWFGQGPGTGCPVVTDVLWRCHIVTGKLGRLPSSSLDYLCSVSANLKLL